LRRHRIIIEELFQVHQFSSLNHFRMGVWTLEDMLKGFFLAKTDRRETAD